MLDLSQLHHLAHSHSSEIAYRPSPFTLGPITFNHYPHHALMGVINLSPDSWYRESVCLNAQAAIARGHLLHAQGAHLIDIGAESSLAHAARVDEATQRSALLPVVRELARSGYLISVETYHPSVTRACFEAGAKVLNLTGTQHSDDFFRLVADYDAALILCFVEGDHVRAVSERSLHDDPIPMLYEFFARQTERATQCGVTRLWIDPGLGFYYKNLADSALRIRHQMTTFLNTFRLRSLGFPTCHALPHAFECFEEEVRCAEPFFAVLASLGQTDLLRTHEVPKVRGVLRTLALGGGTPTAD